MNDTKSKTIIELDSAEAKAFLLKSESYSNLDLPPYFNFNTLLNSIHKLSEEELPDIARRKARDYENVNYTILSNKDGNYAWRPTQLISPVIYCKLVDEITSGSNWDTIRDRFKTFSSNNKIQCLSIPVQSLTKEKDKAEQISKWWTGIEQQSISLALEYDYISYTDITDCYGSIYTHAIAWALHTRSTAKQQRRDMNLIGNKIDYLLQQMSCGQTNGIPQGSSLMDFIAEMVLGYADTIISEQIDERHISEYKILRYRDDYRIFTNSPKDSDEILKIISIAMHSIGFKLNPTKTGISNKVIIQSIKPDRLFWAKSVQYNKDLQKHILIIHDFASIHPNSGTLLHALSDYYDTLTASTASRPYNNHLQIISITADIALHSPKCYPVIMAILSKVIESIDNASQKTDLLKKIKRRFDHIPNNGYLLIWLQRLSIAISTEIYYEEKLCKLVSGANPKLWNVDWINNNELKSLINATDIIDRTALEKITPIIQLNEFNLYAY